MQYRAGLIHAKLPQKAAISQTLLGVQVQIGGSTTELIYKVRLGSSCSIAPNIGHRRRFGAATKLPASARAPVGYSRTKSDNAANSRSNGAISPRDGADLPAAQAVVTKELLSLAVGETRDFEFRPTVPGDLRIEVRHPTDGRFRTSIDVQVR